MRGLAAVVCLMALLMLAAPCPMFAVLPMAGHASMAGMGGPDRCAGCCGTGMAMSAPRLCCRVPPQPAQESAVVSLAVVILSENARPAPKLVPLNAVELSRGYTQMASPPLLHPILRI